MTSGFAPRVTMSRAEAVYAVLTSTNQPLSNGEIRVRCESTFGIKLDANHAKILLDKLVDDNKVFWRVETFEERVTRAGGVRTNTKGHLARLYAASTPVPARTTALHDIVLGDAQVSGNKSAARAKNRKRKLARKRRYALRAASAQVKVPDLAASVAAVFSERDELAARVRVLEKKLAGIRDLLKK